MNMDIIQHRDLRLAISQGLNHIPLRPTNIVKAIAAIMHAFDQLVALLNLIQLQFPVDEARTHLHNTCLGILKAAAKANRYGFRFSGSYIFENPAVKNETDWLLLYLFYSGLDKATNNACFMCIRHIRLQALERLLGTDFLPCKTSNLWDLPSSILDRVHHELLLILPECPPKYQSLPYLMATFKQHKVKYRWLTNSFCTVFTNIAILLTITSKLVLESVKIWARTKLNDYKNFLQVNTSLYWIINSIIDTILNLPSSMHDIFVADISRCYETSPLSGPDNLNDAISFIIAIAFKQANLLHPKAHTQLWVRIDNNGSPACTKWATRRPQYGCWSEFPASHLLSLHDWLMKNCFLTLGDRIWQQQSGIPMGFSYSPIWCNMYLLSYEIKFIQRLARLGHTDLMAKFQYAFRYIDDLCLFNVLNPKEFLDPNQARTENNPYWIYPLNVLEIKEETSSFAHSNPQRGISAHFMNVEFTLNELDSRQFSFQKYNKRRSLPFQYTQYIKFRSNRAVHQAYNIAISQVLPILYISSSNSAASIEIQTLICTMCSNGFQKARLIKIISRFLLHGSFPRITIDTHKILESLSP
jgi:hypothetical protein